MTSPIDPSDAELIASVAAGSEEALGRLYDRHAEAIYGHARRLLADPQTAEEIVQETFLALWNRAETFDPSMGAAAAWLRSIGRHRVVDRLRAVARGPRLVAFSELAFDDDDANADALELTLAGGEPAGAGQAAIGPEASLLAADVRERVQAALETMPEHERTVIELAYHDELSQSEIAERLGWPLGTVKTRTRRALRALRAALGEELEEAVTAGPRGIGDEPR